jgi:hypothetical protein
MNNENIPLDIRQLDNFQDRELRFLRFLQLHDPTDDMITAYWDHYIRLYDTRLHHGKVVALTDEYKALLARQWFNYYVGSLVRKNYTIVLKSPKIVRHADEEQEENPFNLDAILSNGYL